MQVGEIMSELCSTLVAHMRTLIPGVGDIPDIRIPDWKHVGMRFECQLQQRVYKLLEPAASQNHWELKEYLGQVKVYIAGDGAFVFEVEHTSIPYMSAHKKPDDMDNDVFLLNRANAAVLFAQFCEEIFAEATAQLEKDLKKHQESLVAVRRALEPFTPYIVSRKMDPHD